LNAVANDLQAGFAILWYQIESVLGRGGFGITYLARDNNLGQLVAIKEYLPHDFATRSGDSTVQPASVDQSEMYNWGLQRFMSEAQTLAKFKHPNIVRVLSVFKHNNTGYMVMEYEQGEDLSDLYKRKKQVSQQELENIYYPILLGLASVHKEGFIHRDIKPSNIFIRSDGSPVLIDFGAARQAVGGKTKTLTSMLSVGYAPFEQYNETPGKQGPWTDIYALGASMYQGITGEKPIESTIRGMALLHDESDPYQPLSSVIKPAGYSHAFLRAIDQALMIQIHDRPQNLEDFHAMLTGEIILPDLVGKNEKVSEATVIRHRTVIRPRNQKFSGIEITQPDPVSSTERIESEDKNTDARQPTSLAKFFLTQPRIMIGLGAIALIVIIGLVFLFGQKTPEDIRFEKIQALVEKAQQQINAGVYYDKSGQGAFNIYQQVLDLDKNNSTAKQGVTEVAQLMLQQTDQYIQDKDFDKARTQLQLLNQVQPALPGLKQTQQKYNQHLQREKSFKQLEIILSKANNALQKGQVYEPAQDNAYEYFQDALKLDAENTTARLGLFNISNTLISDAQTEINRSQYDRAEKLLALAKTANPDNPSITTLEQKIQQHTNIETTLSDASRAYAEYHYTSPENDNAYDLYKKVLSISPSNQQAKQGLDDIANYYADKTDRYIRSGNVWSAQKNLDLLSQYFPEYPGLANLKSDLSKKRAKLAASQKSNKKPAAQKLPIPEGINQKQDDFQVVQDIVGKFISAFKSRNLRNLLTVTQLNKQQQTLYSSIFSSYKALDLAIEPNSFRLTKADNTASVKFKIKDLVDSKGRPVITSANWTEIEIKILRKDGNWLKAEVY
jgi:serine/threonine protein kinase